MTRFTSKILGVDVGVEQIDGMNAFYQSAICSECGATHRMRTKGSPMPEEAVFKKMRQAGWKPDKRGDHLCQSCLHKRPFIRPAVPVTIRGVTYPSMIQAAATLGVAVSTISRAAKLGKLDAVGPSVTANQEALTMPSIPTDTKPREMSREERRAIFRRLDEVYDTTRLRYVDDWTDHKVAQEMNVPRAWVSEIRDEAYGPEGSNDAMHDMDDRLKEMLKKLEEAVEACLTAAAGAERLNAEVKVMQEGLTKIRAAVGPHAVK